MTNTPAPRRIQHRGPVTAQRQTVVPAQACEVTRQLPAGASLMAAVTQALAAQGATSGVLQLRGGALAPLAHVLPAESASDRHAVYFSARHDAPGPVLLEQATVTHGLRDGQPWLHCHALWQGPDGQRHCGHLLPDDTRIALAITATAWGLHGAAFTVQADDETNFSLFSPVPRPGTAPASAHPALAVRLSPNEDVCNALAGICEAHGLRAAVVRGGVGSTVGAVFTDGRVVQPHITELLVRQGRIAPGTGGQLQAEIDVTMVDHHGGLSEGRLQPGANPVLVTLELVLEPQ